MLGEAYRRKEDIQALMLPLLVVTSEFGTVSMWDWEINRYLSLAGVNVIAPYNPEQTRMVCRSLALKKELAQSSLLVYQDNPGAGFQAEIFKRFYWWEDECSQRMREKFGVTVVKRSFRELGERAKGIPDGEAESAWKTLKKEAPVSGINRRALLSAVKLYLAVKADLAEESGSVLAVGINCLNESHFSDTTPCLAWSLLYAEQGILWGCEADTVSMLTKTLLHRTLGVPVMMTNLYPFLMGMAALKHERIPHFPDVTDHPEDHILAAHCGYLGVLPRAFSSEWTLRPKVLRIVDDNATAIDARLPEGPVTLAKLEPDFESLSLVEGELVGYAQFPGSDCLNGAVLRVPDGHAMMREVASHHTILAAGHIRDDLELAASALGIKVIG
jgi:L-fucose isomerase-like protein